MLIRYIIVGLWNTLFGFGMFYLFLMFLGDENYRYAIILAFAAANLQSHLTQRLLVWKSKQRYWTELIRFFLGALLILALNLITLTVLVDILKFPIIESQFVLTIFITVINFLVQKTMVYRIKKMPLRVGNKTEF
jgi:putative flippase GtrA